MGWVSAHLPVVGLVAPLRAEDQPVAVEQAPVVEQPVVVASPQQPVVEQPQGVSEWHSNLGEGEKVFHSQEDADAYSRSRGVVPLPPGSPQGVYGEGGVYLGRTNEEVRAKEQAKFDAFAATHPDPGDGSGIHDMQGRFMGKNTAEAAAAGFVADPTSPEEIQKEVQRHGTENIYFNKETGDWIDFGKNGKHGVMREEFFDDTEEKAQRELRLRGMTEGRGKLGENVDRQMDETIRQHEQSEKEHAEWLAKERERAQKLIPRTLVSVEKPQGNEQK